MQGYDYVVAMDGPRRRPTKRPVMKRKNKSTSSSLSGSGSSSARRMFPSSGKLPSFVMQVAEPLKVNRTRRSSSLRGSGSSSARRMFPSRLPSFVMEVSGPRKVKRDRRSSSLKGPGDRYIRGLHYVPTYPVYATSLPRRKTVKLPAKKKRSVRQPRNYKLYHTLGLM